MRLTTIQHQSGTGTLLVSMVYQYDQASRVSSQTIAGAATNYNYDALDQLTTVTTGSGTTTYGYDNNGNRNGPGYGVGSNNQMTSDGTWSYTYDSEGNVIQKQNPLSGETWHYTYDNLNELTGVTDVQSGSTVMQATYVYDAFGNRIEKDVWTQSAGTTTVTRFAYDGDQVWAQMDGSNALQNRYIHGDDQSPLLVRESSTGTVGWYLTDANNSVRNITDGSGTIQDTVTYDAYGNFTETNPSYGDRFKYTSGQYDSETGLQYQRARYYDPRTGRWFSQDPVGFVAGDANLYRYAGNSPTNGVDPSGLAQKPAHGLSGPAKGIHIVSDTDLAGDGAFGAQMDARSAAGNAAPSFLDRIMARFPSLANDIAGPVENGALQKANNSLAGFTDGFTGGLTAKLRDAMGTNDTVDTNSGHYKLAEKLGEIAAILGDLVPGLSQLEAGAALASGLSDDMVNLAKALKAGDNARAANIGLGIATGLAKMLIPGCSTAGKLVTGFESAQALNSALSRMMNGDIVGGLIDALRLIVKIYKARTSCFAAGTPLLTRDGERPIEKIRPGDWVLSAPEDDLAQPAEFKRVEQTFETSSRLISLHVGDRTIRTTVLHRFYVRGKGWIEARQIEAGDSLRGAEGDWLITQGVDDPTENEEPVYNLLISQYHTYFVGARAWGLSVWAHNGGPSGEGCSSGKPAGSSKKMRPDANAQGAHTVVKRDPQTGRITHYETFKPQTNPRNPNPWESVKRVDVGPGDPHFNKKTQQDVPTPHVHEPNTPGGVRPAAPDEIPSGALHI